MASDASYKRGSVWARWRFPVASLSVLALAVGAYCLYVSHRTPEATVRAFLSAWQRGPVDELQRYVATSSQQELAQWDAVGMAEARRGRQWNERIGKAKIDGNIARVPVIVELPNSAAQIVGYATVSLEYTLVKEGGRWVIDLEAMSL